MSTCVCYLLSTSTTYCQLRSVYLSTVIRQVVSCVLLNYVFELCSCLSNLCAKFTYRNIDFHLTFLKV